MAKTISRTGLRARHLAPVIDASEDAGQTMAELTDAMQQLIIAGLSRPRLNPAGALRFDQAELFLLSLDTEMLTADSPRASYLLGLAESHLANVVELLTAVVAR